MSHLRPVNPPSTTRENDISRRVAVQHAMDDVHLNIPDGDSDRILLAFSLLGEVVDAYRFGHKNITDEWVRLAAAARLVAEDDLRRAAR